MSRSYEVHTLPSVERDLRRMDRRMVSRAVARIRSLGDNPRPPGCLKLTDREGYRMRVGVYRVLYLVDDARRRVTVVGVKHRSDAY